MITCVTPPQTNAALKAQLIAELYLLEKHRRIYTGEDARIIVDESATVVNMIRHIKLKLKSKGNFNDYSNKAGEKIQG